MNVVQIGGWGLIEGQGAGDAVPSVGTAPAAQGLRVEGFGQQKCTLSELPAAGAGRKQALIGGGTLLLGLRIWGGEAGFEYYESRQ